MNNKSEWLYCRGCTHSWECPGQNQTGPIVWPGTEMCGCPERVPWRMVALQQERSSCSESLPVPHPPLLTLLLCLLTAPGSFWLLHFISPCRSFISLQQWGRDEQREAAPCSHPNAGHAGHAGHTPKCSQAVSLRGSAHPPQEQHQGSGGEHQTQRCFQPPVSEAQWSAGMAAA